ncbi:unnamed protein product [Nippostrongylus brasiliensis]|uniref:FRIGIDA-like protein n=1 Tax=Nippostrongylus brasiliensis TaxID=27835 RepID=A0A0N4YFX2_NIPBR|nr:unnamed protein product [Nippostrongylus brasiliensis]
MQHILEICRPEEVLSYLGSHHDHNISGVKRKKEMDERKDAIIDCVVARAHRIVDGYLKDRNDCPSAFRMPLGPVFATSSPIKVEEKPKKPKQEETQKEEDVMTGVEEVCRKLMCLRATDCLIIAVSRVELTRRKM